ncbi:hypothetical protein [Cyanobium sp. FACHB-13342]|uniref:hypothetical protein n=1 Tax=Cyanobium sp. FACHB-13342 TaxID=2692793 RepID=UPI00168042FB|nr:hypothetical protein [Cyanobium sp. FACHB-13342]MBD2422494.1 hypothetical protein [Cyanobium sp. FACHB-13342]
MQISSSVLPQLHLFGAATPAGNSFVELVRANPCPWPLFGYSRDPSKQAEWIHRADLHDPKSFNPQGDRRSCKNDLWISFAPIWLLAPFLDQLTDSHPERLQGIRGLIACSSSSVITKRFASNGSDRELVTRLSGAEDQLLATCRRLQVPCHILQPTLIYGQAGPYSDRNLSKFLQMLRRLPCLPLPADSGLRQPIHATQLAAVVLHIAQQISATGRDHCLPERITLGGDTTLTYTAMIKALQQCQPPGDPARHCHLLPIPNRLFFSLAAPLLLRSPKAFEAVLRIGANLSGFTPAHQLLGREPQPFPVLPLA